MRVLRQGGFAFKTHGSAFQQAGLPDVVGCWHGVYFGIEVKVPGKTASKLQQRTIDEIKAAGGIAGCVTSADPVIDAMGALEYHERFHSTSECVRQAQEALDAASEKEAEQYQEAQASRGRKRSPRKTPTTAKYETDDEVLQWQRRARRGAADRS